MLYNYSEYILYTKKCDTLAQFVNQNVIHNSPWRYESYKAYQDVLTTTK
jgi:hypothetical protein